MCANIWKVSWAKKVAFTFVAQKKLNLRAQNLMVFIQLAEGVDDATWLHHLHQGDYAHWFRTVIKDTDLAEETVEIGKRQDLPPESRAWSKQPLRSATRRRHDPWRICRVHGLILSSGFTTPGVPDNAVLHAHTPLAAR